MITLAAARALIASQLAPVPAARVPLARALGRVLREPVLAGEDMPSRDRSAMDGYAIAAEDPSARFQIVSTLQPADASAGKIDGGECARVFTGAPIPAGASQVLPQEMVCVEGAFMTPLKRTGEPYIRRCGDDARQGDQLLQPGARLGPGELALLASVGVTRPKVSPPVRVAHLATGTELAAPGRKLMPGQIRDSNSPLVAACIRQFGGRLVKQVRAPDDFDGLLAIAGQLAAAGDLLLLSGGASVGDYDFGKKLLAALGFQLHFTAVDLRPGKPLIFATRGHQAAFVLPGNPVAHLVALHVAVRLALDQFAGAPLAWPRVKARLTEPLAGAAAGRETFWPARVTLAPAPSGEWLVRGLRWQSSGDVTVLAGTNALLHWDAGAAPPPAGTEVPVLLLELP
jgi:molybdopterin molybdotransferase